MFVRPHYGHFYVTRIHLKTFDGELHVVGKQTASRATASNVACCTQIMRLVVELRKAARFINDARLMRGFKPRGLQNMLLVMLNGNVELLFSNIVNIVHLLATSRDVALPAEMSKMLCNHVARQMLPSLSEAPLSLKTIIY